MIKTYLGSILLPVNPLNDVTFSTSAKEDIYDIISFGEYIKLGNLKSTEIEIDSFFTDKEYPFANSGGDSSSYVSSIQGYMAKNSPVRFIIAGDGVNINMLCVITGFKYTIKAGEESEIYYKLALKEYKEPVAKKVALTEGSNTYMHSATVRTERAVAGATHTVQSGDTAWSVAKTYYGDGSQFGKFATSSLTAGMQIKIPAIATPLGISKSGNIFNPPSSPNTTSTTHTSSSGITHGGGGRKF